jgi:hypothetical protein
MERSRLASLTTSIPEAVYRRADQPGFEEAQAEQREKRPLFGQLSFHKVLPIHRLSTA